MGLKETRLNCKKGPCQYIRYCVRMKRGKAIILAIENHTFSRKIRMQVKNEKKTYKRSRGIGLYAVRGVPLSLSLINFKTS